MVVSTWNSCSSEWRVPLCLTWIAHLFCLVQVLLLIPVEFLRWVIIALAGGASSWFVALNLKECTEGADLMVLLASASVLQFALALFIKVFFFAWGFHVDFAKVCLRFLHPSTCLPWHCLTEALDSLFLAGDLMCSLSTIRSGDHLSEGQGRPVLLDGLIYILTLDCYALGILDLKCLICKFFCLASEQNFTACHRVFWVWHQKVLPRSSSRKCNPALWFVYNLFLGPVFSWSLL